MRSCRPTNVCRGRIWPFVASVSSVDVRVYRFTTRPAWRHQQSYISHAPTKSQVRALSNSSVSAQCLTTDTIFALATPNGHSAVAIVRVSGPAALLTYSKLCRNPIAPRRRAAQICQLHAVSQNATDRRTDIIDPSALTLYFPNPSSSTGEDVVEYHVHGSPAIVRSLLKSIAACTSLESPIRHAEPGEFTKRAFLAGKLDLTQAEALGNLLASETEQQRKAAILGSRGRTGKTYDTWQEHLIQARGELEALIDFAEDQQFDESPDTLINGVLGKVNLLRQIVARNVHNAVRGELLRNGIRLTIIGKPNAGKSSLLNALVSREAAIVSPKAGTTRDIVEVSIDIDGFLINIADTAGLRRQNDHDEASIIDDIELEGMKRALHHAQQSDVVLLVLAVERSVDGDISVRLDKDQVQVLNQARESQLVIAINKIDLLPDAEAVDQIVQATTRNLQDLLSLHTEGIVNVPIIPLSCIHKASALGSERYHGLSLLIETLTSVFADITRPQDFVGDDANENEKSSVLSDVSTWHESVGATERQRVLLEQCLIELNSFVSLCHGESSTVAEDVDIVLAAERLRAAALCLARITGHGAHDVEEVLGIVFEKFCVGK